ADGGNRVDGLTAHHCFMEASRGQGLSPSSDLDAHCLRLLYMGRNHHRTDQRPPLDPCRLRLCINTVSQGALQGRDERETDRAIMLRLDVVGDMSCCQVHENGEELRVYRGFLCPEGLV